MFNQFEECSEFRYYQILLTKFDKVTRIFTLTEDEFKNSKELLNWMDFLISTNQWITFELYRDIFGINEAMYEGLENIEKMEIKYIETISKCTDVDLDSL